MFDPGSGARCAIRDTGAPGEGRYHWTVTVFDETGAAAERYTGLRRRDRGQRAGRVAAHSLTLCLFCRRIETQCPILREGAAEDGRVTPSTPLPLGLAGLVIAKPASILFTGGQRNVSRQTGNSLPPLTQWRPVPNVR
jgi:hypothetical protein